MKRSAPLRRTPLARSTKPIARKPMKQWRRKPEDKVPPDEAQFVKWRDAYCVPKLLGAEGPCRDAFRNLLNPGWVDFMTIMHVHDGPTARAGVRPVSDRFHMAMGCAGHGVQSWELSHRDLLVLYLKHVQEWPSPHAARLALAEYASA